MKVMNQVFWTFQVNTFRILSIIFMADTEGEIVVASKREHLFSQPSEPGMSPNIQLVTSTEPSLRGVLLGLGAPNAFIGF